MRSNRSSPQAYARCLPKLNCHLPLEINRSLRNKLHWAIKKKKKTQKTGEGREAAGGWASGVMEKGGLDSGGDRPQLEVWTEGSHPAEAESQGVGVLTEPPPSTSTPKQENGGVFSGSGRPQSFRVHSPPVPQSDRFDLGPTCCRSCSPDPEAKAELGGRTHIRGPHLSDGREDCRVARPAGPWWRETSIPSLCPQAQLSFLLGTQPHEEILGEAPCPHGVWPHRLFGCALPCGGRVSTAGTPHPL